MASNFIQPGDNIGIAAPYAVSSGDGVLKGALFGVAQHDAANGAALEIARVGVYALTKKSGDTPAQGVKLYWDNSLKHITTTATAMLLVGTASAAAASGDATVEVILGIVA